MHLVREQLAEKTTSKIIQVCTTAKSKSLGISNAEAEALIRKIALALPAQYIQHFTNTYFKDQIVDKIADEFIHFQSMENLYNPIYAKHFTDFIYKLVYDLNSLFKRKEKPEAIHGKH